MCQPSSLKGSHETWVSAQMATQCLCRAFQVKSPGIPWGSCSGGRGSRNPGGEEVPPTQEEQEGTREVPEQWGGRGGAQRKVWNFWWWLVMSPKGDGRHCLAHGVQGRAGSCAGVPALWGDVGALSPPDWAAVFRFYLSDHLLLVSLQLCSSELWLLLIYVWSGFLSIKAGFLHSTLGPDVLWVLLLLLWIFFFSSIS